MGTFFNTINQLTMKRILLYVAVSAAVALFFASCSTEKEFNEAFLYDGDGIWAIGGGEYFQFVDGGSGKWWNPSEDVQYGEAKNLQWSISGERYAWRRWMEIPEPSGGWGAYNDFTILDLTATTFKYQNSSGRVYSLTKQ